MIDRGHFADVSHHVPENLTGAVHLDDRLCEHLDGGVGRPLAESSEECTTNHLVVLRQTQRTFCRAHERDECIVLFIDLLRLAVDVCHGIVRHQRQLRRVDVGRELPTVLVEPNFTTLLRLDVFVFELRIRNELELTHKRQRTDLLLGDQVQETRSLLRIRVAGQLLQKLGHHFANLVRRNIHLGRLALLLLLGVLVAPMARGTPSTPLSSAKSHDERLVQHAHV